MKHGSQRCERHAIELLEEAVHSLRRSPLAIIATYYLGSFPFVLGFLFFWTDMSQSAFARERITLSALMLAVLFLWMKFWQMIFARQLLARMSGRSPDRWNWPGLLRAAVAQIILQPLGLFLLPIAVIVTLPLGWVYCFYQNVTVLGGSERALKNLRREALRQAQMWPAQNHLLLAFVSLGALFVLLNLGLACFMIPHLLKMLFGIETVFTRHPFGMLNSTFLAALAGLTYLCLDPLVKTVYALRCFYGQAIASGEDLKAELRSVSGRNIIVLSAFLVVPAALAASAQGHMPTGEPASSRESASLDAVELDRAIDHVLTRPEFSWRMPRAKAERGNEPGWFMSFVRSAFEMIGDWVQAIARFGKKVFEWLAEKLLNKLRPPLPPGGGGTGWITSLQVLLYCLLALIVALLAIMGMRMWRRRHSRSEEVFATAIPAAPDLTNENVLADQLPEEGWLKLGHELMDRGELRLALRAFYLAALAHLGHRELIRIARFKSNRDYEIELRRRAHSQPEILDAFAETVRLFDRVWYGQHEITGQDLSGVQTTLERIATC